MGVPTSEVGYTSAMPRREGYEVRKGHVGHWRKKNNVDAMVDIVLGVRKILVSKLALAVV